MKNLISLIILMMSFTIQVEAQKKIRVTKFERNVTSLIGSMNQVKDNSGETCAVLRVRMTDNDFEIEPNLGVLHHEEATGEVRLWIPVDTKRMTIRHPGVLPLAGFEFPVKLEPKVTYDAEVEIVEEVKTRVPKGFHVFLGAGFNVTAISGPSAMLGLNYKHHVVEVGFVYGLNKTDDTYFYDNETNLKAAYNYQPFRISLRYGYDIDLGKMFSITPQIGYAYNNMNGSSIKTGNSDNTFKSTSSTSALASVRLTAKLSKQIGLYVTPEYNFGLSKEDLCKLIGDNDKTFKSWTEGFNLNVGLIIKF
jgi:opacity protein-like surface antigen